MSDWSLHIAMAEGLEESAKNCSSQQDALAFRLLQAAKAIRLQHAENTELRQYIDKLLTQIDHLSKRLARMNGVVGV